MPADGLLYRFLLDQITLTSELDEGISSCFLCQTLNASSIEAVISREMSVLI